jgi:hypothetical protein
MGVTDRGLNHLAIQAGTGDRAAFQRLHEILSPTTLATIRRDLADPIHAMHVLRGTFCELWWMCSLDTRHGTHRHDVATRVSGIAERRSHERSQMLGLLTGDTQSTGQPAFWVGGRRLCARSCFGC